MASALVCKEGYGRDVCKAFPKDAAADAILITAALETADSVIVRFCAERDYLPVEAGERKYLFNSARWITSVADENLAAQMDAYIAELLRLKQEQGNV